MIIAVNNAAHSKWIIVRIHLNAPSVALKVPLNIHFMVIIKNFLALNFNIESWNVVREDIRMPIIDYYAWCGLDPTTTKHRFVALSATQYAYYTEHIDEAIALGYKTLVKRTGPTDDERHQYYQHIPGPKFCHE